MRNKIKILLIEDEEFDVKRVKNTIKLFENSKPAVSESRTRSTMGVSAYQHEC